MKLTVEQIERALKDQPYMQLHEQEISALARHLVGALNAILEDKHE